MVRVLPCLLIALSLLAARADAQCNGIDQRPTLTEAETAEIDRRLDTQPYPEGNYWRATRDDQTLILIGTLHVDDPRFDARLAPLQRQVRNADLLLLEATETEIEALKSAAVDRPDLLFLTEGPTLIDLLPPADWERIRAAAEARGMPGFMAARFRPWYLSILLQLPPCLTSEIQAGGSGLDKRLMNTAHQAGIPRAALEDYDTVFKLMARDTLEDQVAGLTLALTETEAAENAFATLKAQYFEEATLEGIETARIFARRDAGLPPETFDVLFDTFMDRLLRQRNTAWMTRILDRQERRIVIAVGAAHLTGSDGLLALLDASGFTLERQPF